MANAGYVAGSVAILTMGLVSYFTMTLMLHSKRLLQNSNIATMGGHSRQISRLSSGSKENNISLPLLLDTHGDGNELFIFSSLGLGAFGPLGKFVCEASVFLLLTGVAAGYMIFINSNFSSAVDEISSSFHVPEWVQILVVPVLPCFLVLLRTYEKLAKVASTGVLCVFSAFLVILVVGPIYSDFQPASSLKAFDLEQLPGVLGISAFLLAIHSAVMSFAGELEHKLPLPKMKAAIFAGCIIVSLSNVGIAVYGYFLWGSDVNGYVFCNVGASPAVTTLKFLLVIELLCSLPFAVRPNIEIFEKYFGVENGGDAKVEMQRNVIRVALVLLSYCVTIAVPVFQDCLTLVGGVAGAAVGFVIPAAVHLKLLASGTGKMGDHDFMGYASEGARRRAMFYDVLVIIMGVGIQGWTAYQSVQVIVKRNSSDDDDDSNNGC
jgi:amino acid permease